MGRRSAVWSAFVSIAGIAAISFLAGAVVMFFRFPSSEFLAKALLGARTWYDGEQSPASPRHLAQAPSPRAEIDRPARTFDGFTLYCCCVDHVGQGKKLGTEAFLINMRREVGWAPATCSPISRPWPVWLARRCWRWCNGR